MFLQVGGPFNSDLIEEMKADPIFGPSLENDTDIRDDPRIQYALRQAELKLPEVSKQVAEKARTAGLDIEAVMKQAGLPNTMATEHEKGQEQAQMALSEANS